MKRTGDSASTGWFDGWPGSLAALAAERCPSRDLLQLDAPTDSAALWMLLRPALGGRTPDSAVMSLVRDIVGAAPESRLNLLFCNGSEMWATAWYHSLWTLVDERRRHRGLGTVRRRPALAAGAGPPPGPCADPES